ncbi:MAG: hypothetical protein JWP87_6124 [Labilithrix sp.]|nr:hypothetical protein [Labilithrix sp.]
MGIHCATKRAVPSVRAALLFVCAASAASALALGCAGEAPSHEQGSEDDFTATDFREDVVLPYAGDWLDAPKALAGIGQFDRLRGTIHDDAKCSTMVAIAAAIVGGRERFSAFVDEVARLRDGKREDLAIIDEARKAVAEKRLTARHIHELTEVVVRAYKVAAGAYDEQIATMIRASGYVAVHVGSKRPEVLVDHLAEREVVPLGTVADDIPHITLLWKDARGVVRLYDSDDVHGSHVMPRGGKPYNARVLDAQSSWDLAEKYR